MVSSSFIGLIADRPLTPKEIATSWAQARNSQLGEPKTFAERINRVMIGFHGIDVIKTFVPDKRLARQVIENLPSAYKEVSKQA